MDIKIVHILKLTLEKSWLRMFFLSVHHDYPLKCFRMLEARSSSRCVKTFCNMPLSMKLWLYSSLE